jgi:HAD superfamily hydrolase (TIGR01450 family)
VFGGKALGLTRRADTVTSRFSKTELATKLADVKAFVLDQDGTTYLETQPFSWTLPFLQGLKSRGIDYLFLSNNTSKSADEHYNKLISLGIEVTPKQILSAGEATISFLQNQPDSKDIYLLATPAVEQDFVNAGFNIDAAHPRYVVLAYDLTFTFDKLAKACHYVRNGVSFIATHEDIDWKIAPVTTATGVHPKFIGKPNTEMVQAFLRRLKLREHQVAIVGDRLATDIRMGNDHGILTFLVLSGKTTAQDVDTSAYKPDVIVDKTLDILDLF